VWLSFSAQVLAPSEGAGGITRLGRCRPKTSQPNSTVLLLGLWLARQAGLVTLEDRQAVLLVLASPSAVFLVWFVRS
jgi:hypothetical protein